MFTNEEILRVALEQSAIDSNCKRDVFLKEAKFLCCAWSNIKSARNAIKCGFKPAWAQITVKTL